MENSSWKEEQVHGQWFPFSQLNPQPVHVHKLTGFREVTKDIDAVVSPLVCSQDEPGPRERTGKLLTAITRQRKLLTVKPLALKAEIALQV